MRFVTAAAFVSDTLRLGDRVTINAGFRFDHNRAISQDVPRLDDDGDETGAIIDGRGTMDTWNIVSPRLGCHHQARRRRPNDAAGEATADSARAS